jgi:hypothetical protein
MEALLEALQPRVENAVNTRRSRRLGILVGLGASAALAAGLLMRPGGHDRVTTLEERGHQGQPMPPPVLPIASVEPPPRVDPPATVSSAATPPNHVKRRKWRRVEAAHPIESSPHVDVEPGRLGNNLQNPFSKPTP